MSYINLHFTYLLTDRHRHAAYHNKHWRRDS